MNQKQFKSYLEEKNLSPNTVRAYMWTVSFYKSHYPAFSTPYLLQYKGYLMEHCKPQTVNLRLQSVNTYLSFIHKEQLKIHLVRVQQKNFLENVISNEDYEYLKCRLKNDGLTKWYMLICFLCATGARVSEVIQFKAEHVRSGFIDLYSKGGKMRRLYIPERLKTEALAWLKEEGRESGALFLNRFGEPITTRGISSMLKTLALRYGLNPNVMYPHSFRHRFAKNFLARHNDIALLADLMGHSSIETTRIYLRKTASEQQQLINDVVTW